MNEKQLSLLKKFLSSIEKDKKEFENIMNKTDDNIAKLFRWIIDNDINPYGVFPGYLAGRLSQLQACVQFYHSLKYWEGHGELTFINIKRKLDDGYYELGPKLVTRCRSDSDFVEGVKKDLDLENNDFFTYGEYTYEFEVLNSVEEYIECYIRVENDHRETHLANQLALAEVDPYSMF